MSDFIYYLLCGICVVAVLWGINLMSKIKTSVLGNAWLAPNLDALLENPKTREVLMKTIRMLDTHEEIIGLSGHMLAVSRKRP